MALISHSVSQSVLTQTYTKYCCHPVSFITYFFPEKSLLLSWAVISWYTHWKNTPHCPRYNKPIRTLLVRLCIYSISPCGAVVSLSRLCTVLCSNSDSGLSFARAAREQSEIVHRRACEGGACWRHQGRKSSYARLSRWAGAENRAHPQSSAHALGSGRFKWSGVERTLQIIFRQPFFEIASIVSKLPKQKFL